MQRRVRVRRPQHTYRLPGSQLRRAIEDSHGLLGQYTCRDLCLPPPQLAQPKAGQASIKYIARIRNVCMSYQDNCCNCCFAWHMWFHARITTRLKASA